LDRTAITAGPDGGAFRAADQLNRYASSLYDVSIPSNLGHPSVYQQA